MHGDTSYFSLRIIFNRTWIFKEDYSSLFSVKHKTEEKRTSYLHNEESSLFIENINEVYPETEFFLGIQSGSVPFADNFSIFL